MKKILLASTALVLSAGLAQAQAVRIGGEGRMGIQHTRVAGTGTAAQIAAINGEVALANAELAEVAAELAAARAAYSANPTAEGALEVAALAEELAFGRNVVNNLIATQNALRGTSTTAQENRLQLNFSVGVTGDHGLSFGAFTRVRINNGSPATFSGSRVWVEAGGLRLTLGNQDGAFRGAGVSHGYLGGCGIGYEGGQQCGDTAGLLGRTQGFDSLGGGAPSRARIDYSFGDTRIAISQDRGGSTELGVRSTFDAFTVALGYANRASAAGAAGSTTALSGSYNGGTWSAGLLVARLKTGAASVTNYSLSGSAELGGGRAYGYVGRVGGANAYGLNYGYGLGGGATLTVGAERVGRTTTASLGVAFNF